MYMFHRPTANHWIMEKRAVAQGIITGNKRLTWSKNSCFSVISPHRKDLHILLVLTMVMYRRVGAVDQERWSAMNDNLKYSHNILDKLEGCYWESEPSSLK